MQSMVVTNLTVDLIQDQAAIQVFKQGGGGKPGKPGHTAVSINVPVDTPGNQPEKDLKRIAIQEAKKALSEAIRALETYPV